MNPEAQAVLQEILNIDPGSLTEDQKAFLRARRGYLKEIQLKEYAEALIAPSTEEEPKEDVEDYESLLNRAKELGYTGKRIKRAELDKFILEAQVN